MAKGTEADTGDLDVVVGTQRPVKAKTSLGFKVPRGGMSLTEANNLFCCARIRVKLWVDPNSKDDAEGQGTLLKGDMISIDLEGDVSGFAVKEKTLGFTLSMQKGTVESLDELARFTQLNGKAKITKIEKVKGDAGDEEPK